MSKWMVWDTHFDDKVFHDTEEAALKDYNEAIKDIEDASQNGEHKIFMFKVEKEMKVVVFDED